MENSEIHDKWTQKFLVHLAVDRGASVYTQRNYKQALVEFSLYAGLHKIDGKSTGLLPDEELPLLAIGIATRHGRRADL